VSKQFYNYIYLDPRKPKVQEISGTFVILTHEPFYVGKGSGDRSETKTKLGYHSRYNPYLANKISKIESNALEVLCIKINASSEKEALDREQYLIRLLGREDRKKGTLLNLSDGGEVRPTDNAVKVYQINKDTLELIFVHESFKEAAKIAGGSLTHIYSAPYCQVKGCFWLFEDQYEKGDDFIRDYQRQYLDKLSIANNNRANALRLNGSNPSINIYQIDKDTLSLIEIHRGFGKLSKTMRQITRMHNEEYFQARGYFWLTQEQFEKGVEYLGHYQSQYLKRLEEAKRTRKQFQSTGFQVIQIDPKTNRLIKIWLNANEVCKAWNLGINSGNAIKAVCAGMKGRKTSFGYRWAYLKDLKYGK